MSSRGASAASASSPGLSVPTSRPFPSTFSVLRNAGIVRDEKRGAKVYYILRTPCILNFMSCVEAVIKSKAEEQLDLAK